MVGFVAAAHAVGAGGLPVVAGARPWAVVALVVDVAAAAVAVPPVFETFDWVLGFPVAGIDGGALETLAIILELGAPVIVGGALVIVLVGALVAALVPVLAAALIVLLIIEVVVLLALGLGRRPALG